MASYLAKGLGDNARGDGEWARDGDSERDRRWRLLSDGFERKLFCKSLIVVWARPKNKERNPYIIDGSQDCHREHGSRFYFFSHHPWCSAGSIGQVPGLSKFIGIPLVPGLVWSRVDKSGGKMDKSRFLREFPLGRQNYWFSGTPKKTVWKPFFCQWFPKSEQKAKTYAWFIYDSWKELRKANF